MTAMTHNVRVLMSDELNPKFLGVAGHPFIATPNLDALALRGTRFALADDPRSARGGCAREGQAG
jgi:choline-sulfatase